MKYFLKRHIGLIIILIILLAFPVSLSTQARLNMRIIVTGLAIDKVDDKYEITAQIVNTSGASEAGNLGAQIDFVSDSDSTVTGAISKLSYKTGKVASFSHINFLLLGQELIKEDISQSLDYFIRDRIIKDSALILVADGKAGDEIKKTKDVELSVGLGLQKVFLYKEKESDGIMISLLNFMNNNNSISKTTMASTLSFDDNSSQQQDQQSQEKQDSKKGLEFFKSQTPIVCFVEGKSVGKLETPDEIQGFMLSQKESTSDDLYFHDFSFGQFNNASIGLEIKSKTNTQKIRYENGIPCLDIEVKIKNVEIKEIINDSPVYTISEEEYKQIEKKLSETISQKIATCFLTAKSFDADVFWAYNLAYKTQYKETQKYKNVQEFLEDLKLNVKVKIEKMET